MYFVFITMATIGYGDVTCKTTGGKIFLFFYCLVGLGLLASTLGYFVSSLTGALEATRKDAKKGAIKAGCSKNVAKFYVRWRIVIIICCLYVFLLVAGGFLFGWAEQFAQPRFLNGMYFTFVTLSTIGMKCGEIMCKN